MLKKHATNTSCWALSWDLKIPIPAIAGSTQKSGLIIFTWWQDMLHGVLQDRLKTPWRWQLQCHRCAPLIGHPSPHVETYLEAPGRSKMNRWVVFLRFSRYIYILVQFSWSLWQQIRNPSQPHGTIKCFLYAKHGHALAVRSCVENFQTYFWQYLCFHDPFNKSATELWVSKTL